MRPVTATVPVLWAPFGPRGRPISGSGPGPRISREMRPPELTPRTGLMSEEYPARVKTEQLEL